MEMKCYAFQQKGLSTPQAKADYIIQPAKEAVGHEEGDFSRKNISPYYLDLH